MELTRSAPAKVNLALDILRKRPDGYHDMYMVMQSISLCDTVTVRETADGFALRTGGDFIPEGKKTLEQRAAEAFFDAIGRPMPGLDVTLEKHVPAYAGMGGGSADVAALLRILRDAYAPELTTSELERIGFTVGSDMPFCVRCGTALAEGRGEILTDLKPLPDCRFVICKPDFDVPTPRLFARATPGAWQAPPDIAGMCAALDAGDLEGVARKMGNVFEEALTTEERREIDTIKEMMLSGGALNAVMTGSGPTVFGVFRREEDTAQALEALRTRYSQVFLAKPVPKEV